MAKYVVSQRYSHPLFGEVSLRVLSTATRVTARWKSAEQLSVTVPSGITSERYRDILAQMEPDILSRRPNRQFFTPGWKYVTPEMTFLVGRGRRAGYLDSRVDYENREIELLMPLDSDSQGSLSFNKWVNDTLDRYARRYSGTFILPLAKTMAERLGVTPRDISISYGQRVLGRCNSRGEILLSRNLIFYPDELRQLVIAHEFAHLTHLNHSRRFYELLDRYLDGRHGRLYKALKAHKLPFI